jgi:hypothetical protein
LGLGVGNTPQVTIASGGAVTLTGALNGTSASFTGDITANKLIINPASGSSEINFRIAGGFYGALGIAGASNDIITGSVLGDLNFRTLSSQKILFSTNNGSSPCLTLASTGAATFSSSVTAASGINAIGQQKAFSWQRTAGTASDVYSLNADSASAYLQNDTTSNILMTWLEGGNVGIGTASPPEKLSVVTSTNYAAAFNTSSIANTTTRISIGGLDNSGGGVAGTAAIGCAHYHEGTSESALTFYTYGGGSLTERMRITSVGNTQPGADNAYSLGVSGTRWSAVWAANGTIQTSDEREKKDIVDSDLGLDLITKLRPVSFKWKVGQNVVTSEVVKDEEGNPILDEEGNEKTESVLIPREGKRTHYGLIAQEVEEVLDGKDFGGFIHDEETDTKGLRYDQFVPLLIKSIQELNDKIAILESKLK